MASDVLAERIVILGLVLTGTNKLSVSPFKQTFPQLFCVNWFCNSHKFCDLFYKAPLDIFLFFFPYPFSLLFFVRDYFFHKDFWAYPMAFFASLETSKTPTVIICLGTHLVETPVPVHRRSYATSCLVTSQMGVCFGTPVAGVIRESSSNFRWVR